MSSAQGRSNRRYDRTRHIPVRPGGHLAPRRQRSGTEPVTARSALGLRLVLAGAALVVFAAAAVAFGVWAGVCGAHDSPSSAALWGLTGACVLMAAVAGVDVAVVVRRRRQ